MPVRLVRSVVIRTLVSRRSAVTAIADPVEMSHCKDIYIYWVREVKAEEDVTTHGKVFESAESRYDEPVEMRTLVQRSTNRRRR